MPEPTAHDLTSARLALNWWSWGDPAAPLLMLVHGGRDHGRSWDDIAAAFADRHHVVAPDLRGHGRSGWSDGGAYQLEDFAYDLTRLADLLRVDAARPMTLIGHSLGGGIAMRWAALFPDRVRRLVSIEGMGPSVRSDEERAAEGLAKRTRDWIARMEKFETRSLPLYADLDAAVARMSRAYPQLSPALARHLTVHGVRAVPGGVRFAHDPLILSWPPVDPPMAERERLWAAIACPTLLVYGGKSWATNPEADGRAAYLRDHRTVVMDRAGHWVHHDCRDAVVAAVDDFIR